MASPQAKRTTGLRAEEINFYRTGLSSGGCRTAISLYGGRRAILGAVSAGNCRAAIAATRRAIFRMTRGSAMQARHGLSDGRGTVTPISDCNWGTKARRPFQRSVPSAYERHLIDSGRARCARYRSQMREMLAALTGCSRYVTAFILCTTICNWAWCNYCEVPFSAVRPFICPHFYRPKPTNGRAIFL